MNNFHECMKQLRILSQTDAFWGPGYPRPRSFEVSSEHIVANIVTGTLSGVAFHASFKAGHVFSSDNVVPAGVNLKHSMTCGLKAHGKGLTIRIKLLQQTVPPKTPFIFNFVFTSSGYQGAMSESSCRHHLKCKPRGNGFQTGVDSWRSWRCRERISPSYVNMLVTRGEMKNHGIASAFSVDAKPNGNVDKTQCCQRKHFHPVGARRPCGMSPSTNP
jgi:hypothetical protein